MNYDHIKLEAKWREKWLKEKTYTPSIDSNNHFYNLWMFPYPSAEGLHVGHAFASTGSDIYGRYMRMHGKDVFQPIGYDSFGIHSENFAIKIGEQPQTMLERAIGHYEDQLKKLGHGYDWTRTVITSDPVYYKWTQWLFTELFKAGLAYRAKSKVNWCPSCKTVVSDEQVIDGACERCNSVVEKKALEQWFFRITNYADKLLNNLKTIDWVDKIKVAQANWIGKSRGAKVIFKVVGSADEIEVFTTRPDTLYGATYLALSPESLWVEKVTSKEEEANVTKYIKEIQAKAKDANNLEKEKTGVFTGGYAINPVNGKEIPIWVADYVLSGYGTGAIMAVPAHDSRDWEFAKKYNLPIIEVIQGGEDVQSMVYEGSGEIVNSDNWNGFKYPVDSDKIIADLESRRCGVGASSYHLRDWLISRQRYWGPPIPMIYCSSCAENGQGYLKNNQNSLIYKDQSDWMSDGWWPVEEKSLPVELPYLTDYKPRGEQSGPLADHPEFYEVKCPHCGGDAKRETDVSDTFVDSSWYFLRYPSVGIEDKPFDEVITKNWLPVDLYFGGAEHAVLHLMYARFVTLFLHDLGKIDFEEFATKFFAHGLMIKDGAKMSKSRGNVVNPDEYIEKYGADTLRMYLMFMGPFDGYPDFRDSGIEGMQRFTKRLWNLFTEKTNIALTEDQEKVITTKLHQTIKKVTEDMEVFHYNTAISALMVLLNSLEEVSQKASVGSNSVWTDALKNFTLLLAPFAPHMAEEVWVEVLGNDFTVHKADWPVFDEAKIASDKVVIMVQVNGKIRSQLIIDLDKVDDQELIEKLVREDDKVSKWLVGEIKKTIYVPGKLISFVVA